MTRSVLLTRSNAANSVLKQQLRNYDFDFVDCSLITYETLPFEKSILNSYSDLIITSHFAASNLPDNFANNYVWVVGENSKSLIESKGYKVKFCASDAVKLKKQLFKDKNLKAIYLSGNNITVKMPSNIKRIIFYNTYYKEFLLKSEIQAIKKGIDYILLYSENCAKTLLQLLLENDLVEYLENTTIVAISFKVARVMEGYCSKIENCDGSNQIIEFLRHIND
jgi:uroporphyrinogen-III synthase